MTNLSKNKLLWALVLLLLAANTVMLVLFWTSNKKDRLPPPAGNGQLKEFLISELAMDSNQQQQYRLLIHAHRSAADPLRRQINNLKDSVFSLLGKGDIADSVKKSETIKIGNLVQQLELLNINHFQQVRAICTPAQQQKFDSLIKDIVRMMGAPRPMRGPGQQRNIPPGGPPPGEGPDGPPPGDKPDGPPPPPDGSYKKNNYKTEG